MTMYPVPSWLSAVPGMTYRLIREWQQMAQSGALRADAQLYDPTRDVWQRAIDYPALRPYFPAAQPSWPAILGLGALMAVFAAAQASSDAALRDLGWEDLRRAIFQRDSYACVYCGYRGNALSLHIDHVLPLSRGGSDDPANLATACWSCNLEKGTRTGLEYRLWRNLAG